MNESEKIRKVRQVTLAGMAVNVCIAGLDVSDAVVHVEPA